MHPKRLLPVLGVLLLAGCTGSSTTGAAPTTAPPTPTATPAVTPSAAVPPPVTPTSPAATPEDPLSPRPGLESAPPASGLPACRARDLTVQDADSLSDATSATEVFVVRTTGPDCAMQGYPGVQLLGRDGRALAVTVSRRPGSTPQRVSLTRSTSLSFALSTPRAQPCQAVARIRVRLPGTVSDLSAVTGMSVCSGRVSVSPVGRLGDVD